MYNGFYIVAPLLNNYRYRIFAIAHKLELYPIKIKAEDIDREIKQTIPYSNLSAFDTIVAGDEDEYFMVLGLIFKSAKTIRVIHSLIAQSKT